MKVFIPKRNIQHATLTAELSTTSRGLATKKKAKKSVKTEKKTIPNFTSAVAFGLFRLFDVSVFLRLFSGIFRFLVLFFQSFNVKNCLITYLPIKPIEY